MGWELEFIKLLQRGNVTFFDYLFYALTQFGTELFFILAVMVLYWCVDKREGFRLINLFMIAQLCVGFIKVLVKRPRPYTLEGVRPILEETSGYSFPSGHSNNIAVICADMTMAKKHSAFKFALPLSCIVILSVMFSRVYLGQHYPTDVIAGAVIGVAVSLIGYKLFDLFGDKEEKAIYLILPLCLVLFIFAVVMFVVNGSEFDSVMKISGIYSAMAIGYFIEKKHINYDIKSDKYWRYFVRVIAGALIVLALSEGLKALFNLFAGGVVLVLAEFIRYFVIGIWVTLLAPMLFKQLKI